MKLRLGVLAASFVIITAALVPLSASENPSFCAPTDEKLKVTVHKKEHPQPEPSPGKAMIYVVWNLKGHVKGGLLTGGGGRSQIGCNGKWVGGLYLQKYFYFEAEPGLLRLCQKGELVGSDRPGNWLFLTVEPNKTYYLNAEVGRLYELTAGEGEAALKKCQFVTFEVEK